MNASKISVTAAQVAIAAIITYHVLLFALIFIRPDLDPSWHTISEWAIGPYGWIMSLAFMICSISYACLFVAIKSQLRGVMGYIGLAILLICCIGVFGVGAFTTDPMTTPPDQLTTTGIIHMITGSAQLVLLPFAALLININLAHHNPDWYASRYILGWTSILPLLGLIGFIVHFMVDVYPHGENAYGPGVHIGWPPRILFLTYLVWLITLSTQAIKIRRSVA